MIGQAAQNAQARAISQDGCSAAQPIKPALIEQPGQPGHRTIGRRSVYVQAQLIGHGERYES